MERDIRPMQASDVEGCVGVLAALPDYFTAMAHDEVRRDFAESTGWTATIDGALVGFVLCTKRFRSAAEITFAAVTPELRSSGIGTQLVERCLQDLAADGVRMVEVKTLDATAGYEPYVATRAFWERRGFIQIDCIDPLPGWDPGNPSAIYATAIG